MIPTALGGQHCADDLHSSTTAASRRCRWRWPLLVGALALLGCTVTEDGFEPRIVTMGPEPLMPVGAEASPPATPEANGAPSPPSAEEPSTEGPSGDLPLAPSEPEPPSPPSESSANDGNDDGEGEPAAGEPSPAAPVPEEPLPEEPLPEQPAPEQPAPEGPPASEPPTGGPVVEEPPAGEGQAPDDGAVADPGDNGPGDPSDPVDPSDPIEPPSDPCPSLQFGGSCYEIFVGPATWDVAEQQCVAWGGHLASIGSAEEDAFLDAWPARLGIGGIDGSNLWLGGTDAALDGDFRWSDGTPFQFSGFAAGQPDNGVGVNCIVKRNDGTQRWYDLGCTDRSRFVCERRI